MQSFIDNICTFVQTLYNTIAQFYLGQGQAIYERYSDFVNKQVFGGTLLNIGLTWRELFLYVPVWIISILFIIFIFKIVAGVISLFDLRR